MNTQTPSRARSLVSLLAALTVIGLPVADFVRDGEVNSTLVGALLVVAFGYAGDRLVLARVQKMIRDASSSLAEEEETK